MLTVKKPNATGLDVARAYHFKEKEPFILQRLRYNAERRFVEVLLLQDRTSTAIEGSHPRNDSMLSSKVRRHSNILAPATNSNVVSRYLSFHGHGIFSFWPLRPSWILSRLELVNVNHPRHIGGRGIIFIVHLACYVADFSEATTTLEYPSYRAM